MAASGQVIVRFAAASGFAPSTVERMLRPLREQGMAPIGEKGARQIRGQYDLRHLANVVLSFASLQPSESAQVATALRAWSYGGTEPREVPQKPCTSADTMGQVVEMLIADEARRVRDGHTADEAACYQLDRILFVPGLQNTQFHWYRPDGNKRIDWRADWYVPGYSEPGDIPLPSSITSGGVVRQTVVLDRVIKTAGALLADTMARRVKTAT